MSLGNTSSLRPQAPSELSISQDYSSNVDGRPPTDPQPPAGLNEITWPPGLTALELKRRKNRQAQRKHRQRVRNESSKDSSDISVQSNVNDEGGIPSLRENNSTQSIEGCINYRNHTDEVRNITSGADRDAPYFDQPLSKPTYECDGNKSTGVNSSKSSAMDCAGYTRSGDPQLSHSIPDEDKYSISSQFGYPTPALSLCHEQAATAQVTQAFGQGIVSNSALQYHDMLGQQWRQASDSLLNGPPLKRRRIPDNGPQMTTKYHGIDSSGSDSSSTSSGEDLEQKFEQILDLISTLGFDCFDSLATQYYTTDFGEDSTAHWEQSKSRNRRLSRFLATLHDCTPTWSKREAHGYRVEISRAAENICVSELQDWMQNSPPGDVTYGAQLGERLRESFSDAGLAGALKQERGIFEDKMPETWSFLTELARNAGVTQGQGTRAVLAFLYMLDLGKAGL